MKTVVWVCVITSAIVRCGDGLHTSSPAPYATEVVSFIQGEKAGFGQTSMPAVVLGPPQGKGTAAGSLDVLSLGVDGSIVLGFKPCSIENGPGADFIVFENSFWPSTGEADVFAELGQVSVSEDGQTWRTFPCDPGPPQTQGQWPGCAGWHPVLPYDDTLSILDPSQTGGDAYDLSEVGMQSARYVRIESVGEWGLMQAPTAGFDLDAVGLIHAVCE